MNVYAYDSLWTVKNNHRQYASEKKTNHSYYMDVNRT